MKKINTVAISGMQELLPEEQASFDRLKAVISDTYAKHGFMRIETPVIDRTEILLAKAGGDTEKQIYRVVKTTEAAEGADQALRFDHTVPLARYVVEHESALKFPFKVTQIGRNFRGERAQKGRFREFYQCDVDVIGKGELPLYYDADVIATLLDTFRGFQLKTKVLARINNRKILSGLLAEYNLDAQAEEVYSIIDHAEKVPTEKTEARFVELGLGSERVEQLMRFIEIRGRREEVVRELLSMGVQDDLFETGVKELDAVMAILEQDGHADEISADMKIVRGLDYYTGTVFEFNLPEYKQVGSVCGGGRYENLAGYFTDLKLPGVGGSIGLTRLFYVLRENGLIETAKEKLVDTAVIPMSDAEIGFSLDVVRKLRAEGRAATLVAMNKKLGDKLKYAAEIAKFGIVIGENEVKSGEYKVKEFN